MSVRNGGDAFPSPGVVMPDGSQQGAYAGMTLRDYFAAKALSISDPRYQPPEWQLRAWFGGDAGGITREQIAARQAYEYADAMLAERAK